LCYQRKCGTVSEEVEGEDARASGKRELTGNAVCNA